MPRLTLIPRRAEHCFRGMLTIGRSTKCSYVLEGDSISRMHCKMCINDGQWYMTDMSSNGTLVNSRLCHHQTIMLKHNDVLKIGEYEICYKERIDETVHCSDDDSTVIVVNEEPERVPPPSVQLNSDLEAELKCTICMELFDKTITLNCSHSFCRMCIRKWMRTTVTCPNCRAPIVTWTNSKAIDNVINNIVSGKTAADQLARMELIKEREAREQSAGE